MMTPNAAVEAVDCLHKLHRDAMRLDEAKDTAVSYGSLANIIHMIDNARIPEPILGAILDYCRATAVAHFTNEVAQLKEKVRALGVDITDEAIAARVEEETGRRRKASLTVGTGTWTAPGTITPWPVQ